MTGDSGARRARLARIVEARPSGSERAGRRQRVDPRGAAEGRVEQAAERRPHAPWRPARTTSPRRRRCRSAPSGRASAGSTGSPVRGTLAPRPRRRARRRSGAGWRGPRARDPAERGREPGHGDVASHQDPAAVDPVRGVSGDERETDGREELRETHPGEVHGPAGHGVDLPADRHALHLHAEDRRQPRAPGRA